ncbi:hypothetical protein [Rhodopseudomonas sp.]|uniref:hypothetical protein n=1 Tax=Rhodopseudomonas sp. TaxID=1078 RepID=UPI003B3B85C9
MPQAIRGLFVGLALSRAGVTEPRLRNSDGAEPMGLGLGNKLQNWLDGHGLGAIVAAVLAVIVTLSLILVVGGYWLVTP